ncbi:MAG: TatD family deoxyribonuclease [Candidatus Abyssobacteria bacterium SURF_17]|uniref:TatD family deoxyribonuclease n=1 Tax=Candidatus Abyssobacteria bacterium SURF_17 TaxID=2093361 RepID=A0A419ENN9_9BACT|nr:MAG: TatD family deoxyribonuclease [Candidatus Abyssubacteria bacterium SURF_17]
MNTIRLVDSHAHLEQVEDAEHALERARDVGVIAIIAVAMNLDSNRRILELARRHPGFVYPAVGIHPWAIEPSELDEAFEFITAHVQECVAVGEIGLDYWIKKDKALQRTVFQRLLTLAVEHRKPVLTHSRGSYEDVHRFVKESGAEQAVFHWYSGPVELAEQIVASGYFISATPAVAYSEKHRDVISMVPLDHLLLETDCPVKYQGVISEPASVSKSLEEVARLKGQSIETIARATTQNALTLFGLDRQNQAS